MTGRRWLYAGALVWALLLVAAGAWSAAHDPPTVREQTSLEQGRQRVDDAVAAVRRAAGPGVEFDARPPEVTPGCRVTVARSGSELERVVVLTVAPGQEAALLDRLRDRLPADWRAYRLSDPERLIADAGDFVAVRAQPGAAGEVHVTLRAGCRPDQGTAP